MRVPLLVRPSDADALAAALAAEPDAIVLDLAGATEEDRARAIRWLAERAGTGGPTPLLRIGSLDEADGAAHLAAVMPAGPAGIVLADAVGAAGIGQLANRLAVLEAEHDLPDGSTRIWAEVGSATGALAVATLAGASPRLVALSWNAAGLRADFGLADGADGLPEPFRHLRATALLTAKAARILAIDTAWGGGAGGLDAECRAARRDGFDGKLAAGPEEVAAIRRAFAGR